MPSDRYDVIHNPAENRFEVRLEGEDALLKYYLSDDKIVFTHTGVPHKLSGRGIGGKLARAGLGYARAAGLRVVALCPFVRAYIERHPEYQDLVFMDDL